MEEKKNQEETKYNSEMYKTDYRRIIMPELILFYQSFIIKFSVGKKLRKIWIDITLKCIT